MASNTQSDGDETKTIMVQGKALIYEPLDFTEPSFTPNDDVVAVECFFCKIDYSHDKIK